MEVEPTKGTVVSREGTDSVTLSVVVPVLNEEGSVEALADAVLDVLDRLPERGELIFVDDGSTDRTSAILDRLAAERERVRVAHLRRNFGKAAALTTGFRHARGRFVVTIDGDLQDDPTEIPRLLEKLEEGFDVVSGWKKERRDPWHKTIPSRFFNWTTSAASGLRLADHNSGFKAYRREVLDELDLMGEMHRFITVMAHWRGFAVAEIPVRHHPRTTGRTKYGMGRFFKGAFDFLTVLLTTRYNLRPLHLFGAVGAVFAALGLGILAYMTVLWFLGERPIGTRPLFFLGFLLTLVGVQLVSTGLLGELIVRQPVQRRKETFERKRGSNRVE